MTRGSQRPGRAQATTKPPLLCRQATARGARAAQEPLCATGVEEKSARAGRLRARPARPPRPGPAPAPCATPSPGPAPAPYLVTREAGGGKGGSRGAAGRGVGSGSAQGLLPPPRSAETHEAAASCPRNNGTGPTRCLGRAPPGGAAGAAGGCCWEQRYRGGKSRSRAPGSSAELHC